MSKIALSGDASGTGTFTIASPNSNSNFTLTLPTASGTILTSASQLTVSGSAPAGSLAIDGSGRILTPNQPAFRVVTNTATPGADIIWSTPITNIGNCYNASNGRFTAPVAGVYQFQTSLLRPSSYSADMDIQFWLNGGGFLSTVRAPFVSGVFTGATNSLAVSLAANDYITVRVTNTAPWPDTSWNFWSGYLVG